MDNAIKFSASAEQKIIDIGCQRLRDGSVQFSVRDYGPGVPADQMKKIFKLFYRSESELTRETVGTGIGLALVHQLARAMGGQVDVVNREPGAEFRVNIASMRSDSINCTVSTFLIGALMLSHRGVVLPNSVRSGQIWHVCH